MRHIIIYALFLGIFSSVVNGQVRYFDERYVSSMSFMHPVLINPGATGAEGTHQVIAMYRNKWASFEGAPKSFIVSYDGPISDGLNFGAQFMADRDGSLNTSKLQGALSYDLETADNKLSVGLSGEYIKHGLDSDVTGNGLIQSGDAIIDERILGNGFFEASVGAYGVYDNTITYGVTLPGLVSSRIEDNSNDVDSRDLSFILNLGYIHRPATDKGVTLEPSIYVKQLNNVPFHVDLNLLGRFADDKFRGGVTYTLEADKRVGFLIGTKFNALHFNYTYNISRQEFQQYNNGTHELMMRFDIGGRKVKDEAEMLPVDDMMKKDTEG